MQSLRILIVVIIAVAIGGGVLFFMRRSEAPVPVTQQEQSAPKASTPVRKTYTKFPGVASKEVLENMQRVTLYTTKGEIGIELFAFETPKAVSNFLALAGDGFYDGLTFHRREEGFVIQGGDPNGNGTGGPGYKFEDEPVKRKYTRGIVAMANSGPNTNGSQFFIMLRDTPLPPLYTIFGEVTQGMDVVDAIQVGDVIKEATIVSRPWQEGANNLAE